MENPGSYFVWNTSEEGYESDGQVMDLNDKQSFGFHCGCTDKFNQPCNFVCATEKLIKQHYERKHNLKDISGAPMYEFRPMLKDKRKYTRSNIESGSELSKRLKTSVAMCLKVGKDLKNVKDSQQLTDICDNIKELLDFVKSTCEPNSGYSSNSSYGDGL